MAKTLCGAKTKRGTCKLRPMKGKTRCANHGGKAGRPVKSGRYSKILSGELGDLITRHGECEDELSLAPELAALRAIFERYVNKSLVDEESALEFNEDGATRLLDAVGRMVKRIEDVKAANAISQKDFYRLIEQMALTVKEYVEDEEVREKIAKDWKTLRY